MSRAYEISIMVSGFDKSKFDEIVNAVNKLEFDMDAEMLDDEIVFSPEVVNVRAGMVNKLAKEIHQAVWEANGGFCVVSVGARDLDDEPPTYVGEKHEFEEWLSVQL